MKVWLGIDLPYFPLLVRVWQIRLVKDPMSCTLVALHSGKSDTFAFPFLHSVAFLACRIATCVNGMPNRTASWQPGLASRRRRGSGAKKTKNHLHGLNQLTVRQAAAVRNAMLYKTSV